jgi:hypothetical protein
MREVKVLGRRCGMGDDDGAGIGVTRLSGLLEPSSATWRRLFTYGEF